MPHPRVPMWLGLLLLAAISRAFAAGPAPLPEGFESVAEDGFVSGLFVKAQAHDEEALPPPALRDAMTRCQAKNTPLRANADLQLLEKSEYWLYRTPVHAVLFSRSYDARFDTDKCAAEIYEKREIERMLVADGWSYYLGQPAEGRRSAPVGQSPVEDLGEWPGRFDPNVVCEPASDCKSKRISGVSAHCTGVSGFVGYSSCVSTERGITHGMSVYDVMWTDDGVWHEFKIDELRRNVRISRTVFDLSAEWPAAPALAATASAPLQGEGPLQDHFQFMGEQVVE